MTDTEINALLSPSLRDWVAAHRHEDPHRLALQAHRMDFPLPLAVGQVALLQKAAFKLPAMAQAQCILTARAYEQATSEVLARLKPWGKGQSALDLTCGLGSDSFALAVRYAQVTSLELNPHLVQIARCNAQRLGISNLTILETTAEAYLHGHEGPPFDLMYADPDRRDEKGRRLYGLQDCQPDVVTLLPLMRRHAHRILVKASPMLDIHAMQRLFPEGCFIHVISEANECKELLIQPDHGCHRLGAIFFRKGQGYSISGAEEVALQSWNVAETPRYILEADIALYQADLVPEWFARNEPMGSFTSRAGYCYSAHDAPGFHGHRYRVLAEWPWKPGAIKAGLKGRGISRIQYTRRDFDLSMADVRKQVGIPEGGNLFLLLTHYGERGRWAFLAERLG